MSSLETILSGVARIWGGRRSRVASLTSRIIVALAAFAGVVQPAFAWGSGHIDWQRALVEHLPATLRQHLRPEEVEKSIKIWSKYIDSFEKFEADAELIGPEGMALLAQHKISVRYDFHHDTQRAVNFLLIVEALRAKRYPTALFWIANLGHSTADMSATNHDPLLHEVNYDWSTTGVRLPGGKPLRNVVATFDLSHTAAHPEGWAAFQASIAAQRLADDGRDGAAAMSEIMMYGHEGAAFCARDSTRIFQAALAWVGEDNTRTRTALYQPIAALGAWAVVRVLRDVEVAIRLANAGGPPLQISAALKANYAARVQEHIRSRRLADEELFAPVLRPLPEQGNVAVGVVMEPTWRMNEGMLGYSDRTLAVAICRALESMDRSYATLDLRDVLREGLPAGARLPVLILPARRLNNYNGMLRADLQRGLERYLADGGHVLWIGGTAVPLAAEPLAQALQDRGERFWPIPAEQIPGARLHLAGTGESWTFVRSPNTRSGWQRPYAPFHVKIGAAVLQPLIELRTSADVFTVGALWQSPGGRVAWLPVYALHPLLLSKPGVLDDPSRVRLDAAGAAILAHAMKALEGKN
jgi:hypothetical protein